MTGWRRSEPKIEGFFLQLEIWALKALIAIKPHASIILKVGEAFAVVAALIGGTLVVAIGVLVVGVLATLGIVLAAPFALLAALGYGAIKAFESVKNWLGTHSLVDMGKAMIEGLAQGIENGGAAVLSAMKGAVMGAVDGAKKALGIASPSKVFTEIGVQTGEGMEIGVNRSTDGVQDSLSRRWSRLPPLERRARRLRRRRAQRLLRAAAATSSTCTASKAPKTPSHECARYWSKL